MTADVLDVSIIVPTYHEEANIRALVERLSAAMRPTRRSYQVLIMDDDSRDGTDRAVAELSAAHPVELVTRTGKRDLSLAVIDGLRLARGSVCVVMDADLSHPPESVPVLLKALDDPQVDFALGSRFASGGQTVEWGGFRRLNSWVATALSRPLVGRIADPMSGFFALRRATFQSADPLDPIGYKIGLELICRGHCRHVVEIPITFHDRLHGKSKLSLEQQRRYLLHLDRLYRDYARGASVLVRPVIWLMLAALTSLAWLSARRKTRARPAS